MAVGLDVAKKNLEDLEKEITCAVCQEHYTDPKILPCLHCYCKQCICKLALRVRQGKPFPCPECRKDTVLPEGGEEELKTAFIVNRLKSMYDKHKKALSKQLKCEMCNNVEASAKAFCHQCDKFACQNCVYQHSVMTAIFNGHECVPIEQLQEIRREQLIVPKHPETKNCSIHGEKLKILCFSCNKLICRDCIVKDHKDHDIEFNNVAANNKKKELMEALKPLIQAKESLSQVLTKVTKAESDIQAQEKAATNAIETGFEDLKKLLEMRKTQLVEDVKKEMKQKTANLTTQRKGLSIGNGEVSSMIEYTEQCVRLGSDEEVMSMHNDITTRIQTQISAFHQGGTAMEPLEKADLTVDVDCAKSLHQFLKENTFMTYATIANVFELEEIKKTMEFREEVTFIISNKSDLIIPAGNLKCQFRYCGTGALSEAVIDSIGPNRFSIIYTPTERGNYELEISTYGYPVHGSPFTVVSCANPANFKEPMQVLNNVRMPSDISVNSHREVVVVEYNKAIVVFNTVGEKIGTIDMEALFMNSLSGVAIDCEDIIYFIGYDSDKIGKCDRYLNNIELRDVQEVQKNGHIDIVVVADEVLVTERYNKGQIVVYDRDLNFVRHISTGSHTRLRYLCPDSDGNLYVSTGEHAIVALNMNGDVLNSFNQDQNGIPILKRPYMLHVCGHYVYVADCTLKKRAVFTTEGKFTTTLGHYGPVCIDKHGIMYNGNFLKNSINIF